MIEVIDGIVRDLAGRGSVLVAFSGGVDSSLVAALAHRASGDRAVAVTAVAESFATRERREAEQTAAEIGIEHRLVSYAELAEPGYAENAPNRCYLCQRLRMGTMVALAERQGFDLVCDGTNASDPGPDRPGLAAVREAGVYSPLLAHGLDKATTRALARTLGLSAWDRPANSCLSSRIPWGQVITNAKLRRVESAEEMLVAAGFTRVRVRHDGDGARVEVGADEVERLRREWPRHEERLLALGFRVAELDPTGYRPGGANRFPVLV